MTGRPAIAVVVPFHGDAADARELADALDRLERSAGDELVVADNTREGLYAAAAGERADVAVVHAALERSSYYARNVGVEATTAPWLLFVDSDCRPPAGLLDAYFAPGAPAEDVGILAGAVTAQTGQTELAARYAASRGHIDPAAYEREGRRPAGITANLLVRRSAWEQVGGFHEGIKSGADLEFCWRVQDAGWGFDRRPGAALEHEHVRTLRSLRRKTIRHAGGGGWVNGRYPEAFTRPALARGVTRALVGVPVWLVALQPTRALFKGIDGLFLVWDAWGRTTSNRAERDAVPTGPVVLAAVWPRPGAAALPPGTQVEALARPVVPDRAARRAIVTTYAEDDGGRARATALAQLLVRRPRRTARLLRAHGVRTALLVAPAAVRCAGRPVSDVSDAGAEAVTALRDALR